MSAICIFGVGELRNVGKKNSSYTNLIHFVRRDISSLYATVL